LVSGAVNSVVHSLVTALAKTNSQLRSRNPVASEREHGQCTSRPFGCNRAAFVKRTQEGDGFIIVERRDSTDRVCLEAGKSRISVRSEGLEETKNLVGLPYIDHVTECSAPDPAVSRSLKDFRKTVERSRVSTRRARSSNVPENPHGVRPVGPFRIRCRPPPRRV
jgi:hypothetical protein